VIIAKGNHIQHYLNGWQTVEFKNVRLKELK
jgi:hypothetical protein